MKHTFNVKINTSYPTKNVTAKVLREEVRRLREQAEITADELQYNQLIWSAMELEEVACAIENAKPEG